MLNTSRLLLANKTRLFSTFAPMPAAHNFLVVIKDFTDPECLQRRINIRDTHLKDALVNQDKGFLKLGGAILDKPEDGKMEGSYLIVTAESIEEVDTMLKNDPYYKAKVWEKWETYPIKIAVGSIAK